MTNENNNFHTNERKCNLNLVLNNYILQSEGDGKIRKHIERITQSKEKMANSANREGFLDLVVVANHECGNGLHPKQLNPFVGSEDDDIKEENVESIKTAKQQEATEDKYLLEYNIIILD